MDPFKQMAVPSLNCNHKIGKTREIAQSKKDWVNKVILDAEDGSKGGDEEETEEQVEKDEFLVEGVDLLKGVKDMVDAGDRGFKVIYRKTRI